EWGLVPALLRGDLHEVGRAELDGDGRVPPRAPHVRGLRQPLAESAPGGETSGRAPERETEVRGVDDADRAARVAELHLAEGRRGGGRGLPEGGRRRRSAGDREQKAGPDP